MIYLKLGLLEGIGSQHSFINLANCYGVFLGIVGRRWFVRTYWDTSCPLISRLINEYFCMEAILTLFPREL